MGAEEQEAFQDLANETTSQLSRGNQLTFRRRVAGALNKTTGKRNYTNTDTLVDAIRGASRQERDGQGVLVQYQDFQIKKSALDLVPTEGDQILDPDDVSGETKTYRVIAVGNEVQDTMYRLRTRSTPATEPTPGGGVP